MATITRFEDIEAWQKARILTRHIYDVTGRGAFARDFGLRDQIRRAGVSTMSNIAEGFERGGNKEFIQFLSDAKGSTGEVNRSFTLPSTPVSLHSPSSMNSTNFANETSRLVGGFMSYLQSSTFRGNKFLRT